MVKSFCRQNGGRNEKKVDKEEKTGKRREGVKKEKGKNP